MKKLINTKRVCAAALALAMALALVIPSLSMPASAANPQRFTDVAPDAWYAEAVNAMADAGIINGYGDGSFKPNNPMTAGELATVLWNMTYGKWCKATELYNPFGNGTAGRDFGRNEYRGTRYDGWGVPKYWDNENLKDWLVPTTWDGSVALAIYGDARHDRKSLDFIDETVDYIVNAADTQITITGRRAGSLYNSCESTRPGDSNKTYARNMSGVAVVAMSKEYVTRGFAISELVNVLRETGHLENIYNTNNKGLYASGASIPDWQAITNPYQDICTGSTTAPYTFTNQDGHALFHDYTWAWNYIDDPGKVSINGGYAATWFSADILLAYQAGLINGVDSTGRCNVNARMTRAEVCQMLYNAGAGKTDLQAVKSGSLVGNGTRFIRDSKAYMFNCNNALEGNSILAFGPYDPNSPCLAAKFMSHNIGVIYSPANNIDLRQQEWPTHPEFWG